jgi:hypothetical protein
MKFKTKILHFKKQQILLLDFLQDPGNDTELTMVQKVKLAGEVYALQFTIERLERMPISEANRDCFELPMHFTSALVKPRIKKQPLKEVIGPWMQ